MMSDQSLDPQQSDPHRAPLETYRLGDVAVEIHEGPRPGRRTVICSNDRFRSTFDVSEYEITHYRRHMNQKISQAFRGANEEGSEGEGGEDES